MNCRNLKELRVFGAKVGDEGLAYFKDCKNLTDLRLTGGAQLTDPGIAYFKDCKHLASLKLHQTKVTAKGVEEFAKALPQCKVEWDGGDSEPGK